MNPHIPGLDGAQARHDGREDDFPAAVECSTCDGDGFLPLADVDCTCAHHEQAELVASTRRLMEGYWRFIMSAQAAMPDMPRLDAECHAIHHAAIRTLRELELALRKPLNDCCECACTVCKGRGML